MAAASRLVADGELVFVDSTLSLLIWSLAKGIGAQRSRAVTAAGATYDRLPVDAATGALAPHRTTANLTTQLVGAMLHRRRAALGIGWVRPGGPVSSWLGCTREALCVVSPALGVSRGPESAAAWLDGWVADEVFGGVHFRAVVAGNVVWAGGRISDSAPPTDLETALLAELGTELIERALVAGSQALA